jgi:hypothetical protein
VLVIIKNTWIFFNLILLHVLTDYDNPIFEKFGKGGTYPRRYHVSYHHQEYNDGELVAFRPAAGTGYVLKYSKNKHVFTVLLETIALEPLYSLGCFFFFFFFLKQKIILG